MDWEGSARTESASTSGAEGRLAAKAAERVGELVSVALTMAADGSASASERAETLMELALGLQSRPKTPDHLNAAVELYDRALEVCPADHALLAARVTARKGTALQAIAESGPSRLEQAREAYEMAIPVLKTLGTGEEVAEAEMNLGLVLQQLVGFSRARLADAIAAYQRALRTFDAKRFPVEFAIIQNNLATCFLAMPFSDEHGNMREALAVQCFEEALKVVTYIDHPVEYAMLQNNLGNALQHAGSVHPIANRVRALLAYDEALKVRTLATAPLEYANTIANKANCLWNLPDDPERPEAGNGGNLRQAKDYYEEAWSIFSAHGELEKADLIADSISQLDRELTHGQAS